MDGSRFDTLTRSLTRLESRRAAVSTLVAGSLALLGLVDTAAKQKGKSQKNKTRGGQNRTTKRQAQTAAKKCRREGHPCEGNQRGSCCSGLVCVASGPGNAERCTSCPPGTVIFQGACCTPATCPPGTCGSGISDQCGGTLTCSCAAGENCCASGQCIAACLCGQTFDPAECTCDYPPAGTCTTVGFPCERDVPDSGCGPGCTCGPCHLFCTADPQNPDRRFGTCCPTGGVAADGSTPCLPVCP